MKKTLLVLFMVMLLPLSVLAQSSGKIAGVVTDKGSGEPLPGVNVVIEGTSFGSATDEDGYYVILSVPVGAIKLTASFIGYATVAMENVRVSAGITTEANFQLETTQLELGEAIIIIAERPLVEKNVTSSVSLVTSEQIENIPIRGMQAIAATQNSVVVQDGNLYIRGGRADEVGFYLNGASTNSIRTGNMGRFTGIHVIQEAVEEFQVMAGGYSAEYGSANSGIISSDLKTGGEDYHFSMDFQTDKFADYEAGDKFLGTYSYGQHNFVGTFSGPLYSKKVRAFVAFENMYQADRRRRFSTGWEFDDVVDMNLNTTTGLDTFNLSYPDGFTPNQEFKRNSINGTILFDFTPIRFQIGGTFQKDERQLVDFTSPPSLTILNDRKFYDLYDAILFNAKITHVLSPTTLYEARFNYVSQTNEFDDSYFGNDWMKYYDSAAVYDKTGGEVVYLDSWTPDEEHRFTHASGFPFDRNGDPYRDYYLTKEKYLGGGLDFTTQYGRHHEIKAGIDYKYYTVSRFRTDPAVMSTYKTKEAFDATDVETLGAGLVGQVNIFGYDFYGNELDEDYVENDSVYMWGAKHPVMGAFYIQDKIEYNDLIINAGIRMDYFDSDDRELKSSSDPATADNGQILLSEWSEKDAEIIFSPRLGFSFPVSTKTVFYMQYGKYVQMPSLDNVYYGSYQYQYQMITGGRYFGNNPVGYAADPIKSTSYEIGFRQQLAEVGALDITGFYKNVMGQLQIEKVKVSDNLNQDYLRRVNGGFVTTKGLELKVRLKRTNRLATSLNYTFTSAEGTASTETSHVSAAYRGTQQPTLVNPVDFNRPHKGSILLDYRYGKKDGGPVLENLGFNVAWSFSSGHPFTLANPTSAGQTDGFAVGVDYMNDSRARLATEAINSSSTPWTQTIDLKIDKSFRIMDKLDAMIYLRINNLLNTRNVLNVYDMTGDDHDDGAMARSAFTDDYVNSAYGDLYQDMYKAINYNNADSYWDEIGNQMWGNPRQIMFGIKLNY